MGGVIQQHRQQRIAPFMVVVVVVVAAAAFFHVASAVDGNAILYPIFGDARCPGAQYLGTASRAIFGNEEPVGCDKIYNIKCSKGSSDLLYNNPCLKGDVNITVAVIDVCSLPLCNGNVFGLSDEAYSAIAKVGAPYIKIEYYELVAA